MLPKIPGALQRITSQLPQAEFQIPKTKEEKLAEIKKRFNLTHGKGKRKSKKKGK